MLEGIKVVEVEGLGPAPFAGMMLADLGADVTVIHRKGKTGGITSDASLLDRGNRSIALDLKDAGDREIALAMIARADALLEVFARSEACVAPVLRQWEAAAEPHMQARGIWQEAHGALQPAPAPRFDGARAQINAPAVRDADRASILAELAEDLS